MEKSTTAVDPQAFKSQRHGRGYQCNQMLLHHDQYAKNQLNS